MAWKEVNVLMERLKFVIEVEKGERPLCRICSDYGISRQTGYKWLIRYKNHPDPRSLENLSKRPHQSPSQPCLELRRK